MPSEQGDSCLELGAQPCKIRANLCRIYYKRGHALCCPRLRVVEPADAILLGSPIGGVSDVDGVITAKGVALQVMEGRVQYLHPHA